MITRRSLLKRIAQAVPVAGLWAGSANAERDVNASGIASDGVLVLRVNWDTIERDPIATTNAVLDRLLDMMPDDWRAPGWENRFSFCLHPMWVARLLAAHGRGKEPIARVSGLRHAGVAIVSIGGAHPEPDDRSLYAVLGYETYPQAFAGPMDIYWRRGGA